MRNSSFRGAAVHQVVRPARVAPLWPAARNAGPDTVVLADGFSCRTQLAAGHTGREGWHLAQLLARVTETENPEKGMP